MKHTGLTEQQTAQLCRGLALYLHAGMGLGEGLFLLSKECDGDQSLLYARLGQLLDEGKPLSGALGETGAFPPSLTGMVQVGERTGRMEEALEALADYYDLQGQARQLLAQALLYPVLIALLMLAVMGVLLTKVLPVFDSVYAALGGGLTGLAGGLLTVGGWLNALSPVLLGLLAVLLAAALAVCLIPTLRKKAEDVWNDRRGDKGAARAFNNARFARGLAMGLYAGLPADEAAELAGGLLSDVPEAKARIDRCLDKLGQGGDLCQALTESDLLSPADGRLLALGLRSGAGDRVMEDIARRQMESAVSALERRTARIEPTLVLGASAVVGVILLSVMLPLMDILLLLG
ncbi:MAG: type II secretion system F family protein [Clostridia bacterium]|nr:type II secretion system F family protein [Clostridia bacterium]